MTTPDLSQLSPGRLARLLRDGKVTVVPTEVAATLPPPPLPPDPAPGNSGNAPGQQPEAPAAPQTFEEAMQAAHQALKDAQALATNDTEESVAASLLDALTEVSADAGVEVAAPVSEPEPGTGVPADEPDNSGNAGGGKPPK